MRFLFFGQIYSSFQCWLETAVSTSLRLQGHEALHIQCGPGAFSLCDVFHIDSPPGQREEHCKGPCTEDYGRILAMHGVEPHGIQEFWTAEEEGLAKKWAVSSANVEDLRREIYRGYPLFEIAKWSVYRYLRRFDTLDPNGKDRWIFTEMMKNARLAVDAAERVLDHCAIDRIVLWNGFNSTQRALMEVAKKRGIKFFSLEHGMLHNSCMLFEDMTAGVYDFDREWESWKDHPLSPEETRWIQDYMASRQRREGFLFPVGEGDALSREQLCRELQIPPTTKLVTLFTNCSWDTAIETAHRPFHSQVHWIEESLRIVAKHPNWHAVVRIHPAENSSPGHLTREPLFERLQSLSLPVNVRVIRPETKLDSYSLMRHSDLGIPYVSTVGMEMACLGRPVLSGGFSHYSDKGFSPSFETIANYTCALEEQLRQPQCAPGAVEAAHRYSHLFFRWGSMVMDFLEEPRHAIAKPRWSKAEDLLPGRSESLDRIVETILGKRKFVPPPKTRELERAHG